MNKLELISALKNEANISKSDAAKVIQIFFDSMADAMAKGERVEIRGLCSFFVKKYKLVFVSKDSKCESINLAEEILRQIIIYGVFG